MISSEGFRGKYTNADALAAAAAVGATSISVPGVGETFDARSTIQTSLGPLEATKDVNIKQNTKNTKKKFNKPFRISKCVTTTGTHDSIYMENSKNKIYRQKKNRKVKQTIPTQRDNMSTMNERKKSRTTRPRRISTVSTASCRPTSSPTEPFPIPSRRTGHNDGHSEDQDEFVSHVMIFLSALQPLFESGCEDFCNPGWRSAGSEKILAIDARNYEDLTIQFQQLLEKVHYYKSAQLNRKPKVEGRDRSSMAAAAAAAMAAVETYAQHQHTSTNKIETHSTELLEEKCDHNREDDMSTSASSYENYNHHSEISRQRRKLARRSTRERKKLGKQRGGFHMEPMIYRHDDESVKDGNGEAGDSSSEDDLPISHLSSRRRRRQLQNEIRTSISPNVLLDMAMGNDDDDDDVPICNLSTRHRRKEIKNYLKKRLRLEMEEEIRNMPIAKLSYERRRKQLHSSQQKRKQQRKSVAISPSPTITPNNHQRVWKGNTQSVSTTDTIVRDAFGTFRTSVSTSPKKVSKSKQCQHAANMNVGPNPINMDNARKSTPSAHGKSISSTATDTVPILTASPSTLRDEKYAYILPKPNPKQNIFRQSGKHKLEKGRKMKSIPQNTKGQNLPQINNRTNVAVPNPISSAYDTIMEKIRIKRMEDAKADIDANINHNSTTDANADVDVFSYAEWKKKKFREPLKKSLERTGTDLPVAKTGGNHRNDGNDISMPQKSEWEKSEENLLNEFQVKEAELFLDYIFLEGNATWHDKCKADNGNNAESRHDDRVIVDNIIHYNHKDSRTISTCIGNSTDNATPDPLTRGVTPVREAQYTRLR